MTDTSGNFPFISDNILRSNLNISFNHIIDLINLSESDQYKNEPVLLSSLRKTIIIHTASILEALLLYKLKSVHERQKIELPNEWKYLNIKILYEINTSSQIIAGERKTKEEKLSKLDFNKIIRVCSDQRLISIELKDKLNKVRKLRNRLHLGGLKEMERKYTREDLEFCFSVAKNVKKLLEN